MSLKKMPALGLCAAVLSLVAPGAHAQDKEIKVGVIYDQTGPFAGGGSVNAAIGTQIAIDLINERGGIEGYKIVPVNVDAQSKADVAINAAERLLNEDKVNLIMGVYSSAECVPMAAKVDSAKGFMWANVCISSAVFKDRNLTRVFRAQVHSDQYGEASCKFLAEVSKEKLGIAPGELKVAIIHEDGPYGSGVAKANAEVCKALGINVVLDEGYAVSATDLSPLIAKLRRARPDVILHTGYNPDIALFLRQAKEQGLKWKALIGHGAGYANIDRIRETAGKDVDYVMDVDPVASQLLDPKTLAPGLGDVIAEVQKRFKAKTGQDYAETNVWMGFNQSWILFTDVIPRAIKKYGGVDPEALRKAALDTDIPVGGTTQGYGVKFFPPGASMAGQNERSFPVVIQHNPGGAKVVWPKEVRTAEPVLPLPKGQTYAP